MCHKCQNRLYTKWHNKILLNRQILTWSYDVMIKLWHTPLPQFYQQMYGLQQIHSRDSPSVTLPASETRPAQTSTEIEKK